MNIYIGHLTIETTEEELRETFAAFGEVQNVRIVRDGTTGESRGFGFVEMASDDEAKAAIEQLNGKDLNGNELTVEAGRSRTPSAGFGGRRPGGRGRPGGGRPGGRPGGRGRPGGGGGRPRRGPSRGSDRGGMR